MRTSLTPAKLGLFLVTVVCLGLAACAGEGTPAGDGPVAVDSTSTDQGVTQDSVATDLVQADSSKPPPDKGPPPPDMAPPQPDAPAAPPDKGPPPPDTAPPPPDQGPACKKAQDCDDKLSCTVDACQAGTCTYKVNANFCAIGSTCVFTQTVNSKNPCKRCLPKLDPTDWSDYLCTRTLAGFGKAGSTDGANSIARFYYPSDVAYGTSGEVYVADTNNHTIRLVFGGQVSILAGQGKAGFADGAVSQARFKYPGGLAVGKGGEIYVADTNNHRIRKIANGKVTTVAGSGKGGHLDGFASSARFSSPAGLALGASGEIYVADTNNHRIRTVFSGKVSTLAGTGSAGHQDGSTATARFYGPADVAVGPKGEVYVADMYNHRLRKVVSGLVSTLAGTGKAGHQDGAASTARFYRPSGLAVGTGGTIYVADRYNHRVRKVLGGQVTTLSGTGKAGHGDSPALDVRFYYPTGVALGAADTLYVADHHNHRIRRVTW